MGKEIMNYKYGTFTWTMTKGNIVGTWFKFNETMQLYITFNRTADIIAYDYLISSNIIPVNLRPVLTLKCRSSVWNAVVSSDANFTYEFTLYDSGYIDYKCLNSSGHPTGWGNPWGSFTYITQK